MPELARPTIAPGDWIDVEGVSCVVATLLPSDGPIGEAEVVFNASKPTNRPIQWDGHAWRFVQTGDYGGYADKYPRLRDAVQTLKRGRYG